MNEISRDGARTQKSQSEVGRKIKYIWADLLEKHSRKMISQKNKEKIATTRLNKYLTEDLGMIEQYSESVVHHKVDNF